MYIIVDVFIYTIGRLKKSFMKYLWLKYWNKNNPALNENINNILLQLKHGQNNEDPYTRHTKVVFSFFEIQKT